MVRDDTAIPGTEQGQLSAGHGRIIVHLQPVARRTAKPTQPDWPKFWARLLTTKTALTNIPICRFAGNRLRMVLGPVNSYLSPNRSRVGSLENKGFLNDASASEVEKHVAGAIGSLLVH